MLGAVPAEGGALWAPPGPAQPGARALSLSHKGAGWGFDWLKITGLLLSRKFKHCHNHLLHQKARQEETLQPSRLHPALGDPLSCAPGTIPGLALRAPRQQQAGRLVTLPTSSHTRCSCEWPFRFSSRCGNQRQVWSWKQPQGHGFPRGLAVPMPLSSAGAAPSLLPRGRALQGLRFWAPGLSSAPLAGHWCSQDPPPGVRTGVLPQTASRPPEAPAGLEGMLGSQPPPLTSPYGGHPRDLVL